jgi:hypothetical protein
MFMGFCLGCLGIYELLWRGLAVIAIGYCGYPFDQSLSFTSKHNVLVSKTGQALCDEGWAIYEATMNALQTHEQDCFSEMRRFVVLC